MSSSIDLKKKSDDSVSTEVQNVVVVKKSHLISAAFGVALIASATTSLITLGAASFYLKSGVVIDVNSESMTELRNQIKLDVENIIVEKNNIQTGFFEKHKIEIEKLLKSSEQTFSIYSKEYVNTLVDKAAENLKVLVPEGSLGAYARKKMNSFLMNEDLKNVRAAENHGVDITGRSDETLSQLKECESNLAFSSRIIDAFQESKK